MGSGTGGANKHGTTVSVSHSLPEDGSGERSGSGFESRVDSRGGRGTGDIDGDGLSRHDSEEGLVVDSSPGNGIAVTHEYSVHQDGPDHIYQA